VANFAGAWQSKLWLILLGRSSANRDSFSRGMTQQTVANFAGVLVSEPWLTLLAHASANYG